MDRRLTGVPVPLELGDHSLQDRAPLPAQPLPQVLRHASSAATWRPVIVTGREDCSIGSSDDQAYDSEKSRCSSPAIRLLAALCDPLPADRIAVVEHVLDTVTGPGDPGLNRFIAAQPAAGLAQQLSEITRAWRAEAPGMTGTGLALAPATARSVPRPRPAQVAVSGPMSASVPARLTSGVAVEVIRSAGSSLLIASFAAHGARNIVAAIGRAVARGVQVDLLLEESTQASAAFTTIPDRVRVWHRTGSPGVLHAKLIAADRHTALVGSADLTDRALTDSIELGIVLHGPHLVEPLVDRFRWLLNPENHVMRPA